MAAAAGTAMLRSAASKIARASPLHHRRLVGMEHGSRPSSGPALAPVPRSSSRLFSSSPSAGSTPPPIDNKDLACNCKVHSELERSRIKSMRDTNNVAYIMMLSGLICFGWAKLSLDAASREREKFKDDMIQAIKHEYQVINETLDKYAAGRSMKTPEKDKERCGSTE
ncbi:hypothetical protein EJB05_41070 [Eragrostis curvula]|uniref:Uncharacterized protein n=1 Tax=Eragrostis curvula TaxID=38414 RepID=A0A5J9T8S7_9POAL|nr:hypothetical protein EJB05_41070 [Eragrostis curvula]